MGSSSLPLLTGEPALSKRPDKFYRDAVKDLRKGIVLDRETGERTGKLADGFEARDGFDLRDVDDWTPAQKAKVTKLWNLVDKLTAKPFQVVRKRKPENIRAVQEFAQHGKYPPELKVGIIKVAYPEERAQVDVDPDTLEVTVTERGVSRTKGDFEDFDIGADELEEDARGYLDEMFDELPEGRMYGIQAGEYEVNQVYTREGVTRAMIGLMNKYSTEEGYDEDDKNSSHWTNWLGGVVVYDYDRVIDAQEWLDAEAAASDAVSRYRRREADRFEREYGVPKTGRRKKR